MERKYTNRRYLDALNQRVLVYDGAMGTSLQQQKLTAAQFGGEQYNGCNDYLVISYPEAVEKVHRSFLEVGVDVIETDTFRANRLTLAVWPYEDVPPAGSYGVLVEAVSPSVQDDPLLWTMVSGAVQAILADSARHKATGPPR